LNPLSDGVGGRGFFRTASDIDERRQSLPMLGIAVPPAKIANASRKFGAIRGARSSSPRLRRGHAFLARRVIA